MQRCTGFEEAGATLTECDVDDFDLMLYNTVEREDKTLGVFNSLNVATVAYDREVVKAKGMHDVKCQTGCSSVLCSDMLTAFAMQASKH